MQQVLFPILIAASVSLAVFGIAHLLGLTSGSRRRIKQRLSMEAPGDQGNYQRRSVILQTEETGLARIPALHGLHRQLTVAYPGSTLEKFFATSFGVGLATALVIGGLSGSIVVTVVAFAFGAYIPFFILMHKRSKRQRMMADQLPEALDFLSRILRAGHSFSTGLQMMGEELPEPLAGEFVRAHQMHSLGAPMEDCMREMAARVNSTDFSFFVTAVLIQRQTGGDLAEVLTNISDMIRQRIRLQGQVKAKTAEGRFTGYILVAFPMVMFLLSNAVNPDYAGKLLSTKSGLMMLVFAGVMMMLGLLSIRKITTVKV